MYVDSHRFHHHDPSERRAWQEPEPILASLGLRPGAVFVDVGCGDGFFALPAAAIVGPRGHVYGVDIDGVGLAELQDKAQAEGLSNIFLVQGEAESTVLCDACADVVFFGIDLHDFRDQGKVLQNARAMVKPGGVLADLDWKKEPTRIGPPLEIRFSIEHARGLIEKSGFTVESVTEPGPMHYLLIARPMPQADRAEGGRP